MADTGADPIGHQLSGFFTGLTLLQMLINQFKLQQSQWFHGHTYYCHQVSQIICIYAFYLKACVCRAHDLSKLGLSIPGFDMQDNG